LNYEPGKGCKKISFWEKDVSVPRGKVRYFDPIIPLYWALQQLAVPKVRIEKVLFWDVLEEFLISQ
jgi:hypothetical protein